MEALRLIRENIRAGNTEEALDHLLKLNLADQNLKDEVIQLSSRFQQWKREEIGGRTNDSKELRKIEKAILHYVRKAEKNGGVQYSLKDKIIYHRLFSKESISTFIFIIILFIYFLLVKRYLTLEIEFHKKIEREVLILDIFYITFMGFLFFNKLASPYFRLTFSILSSTYRKNVLNTSRPHFLLLTLISISQITFYLVLMLFPYSHLLPYFQNALKPFDPQTFILIVLITGYFSGVASILIKQFSKTSRRNDEYLAQFHKLGEFISSGMLIGFALGIVVSTSLIGIGALYGGIIGGLLIGGGTLSLLMRFEI